MHARGTPPSKSALQSRDVCLNTGGKSVKIGVMLVANCLLDYSLDIYKIKSVYINLDRR